MSRIANPSARDKALFDVPVTVERSAPDVREAHVFARAEWEWVGDPAAPERCVPQPDTWCKPHPVLIERGVLALVCCPACSQLCALVRGVHSVQEHNGKVAPAFKCAKDECGWHRTVYLDKWNDKPLYAVAYERFRGSRWVAEIEYCHAQNAVEARRHIGGNPDSIRIVAIGPAIGYKAMDNHGERLVT